MKRGYYDVIYKGRKMAELMNRVETVAKSDARVLITGESGTGKELIARKIYEGSPRSSNGLVTVNCPGLTETLLESELFGHEKGAFTDARESTDGLVQRADKGILFVDEISEASKKLQGIFLRFLETGEVQKVGYKGQKTPVVDTRVIAASNRDLTSMVDVGEFRRDLYYRIKVVHLHVPPLRERRDDIPKLIEYFMGRYSNNGTQRTMDSEAMEFLRTYHWPGNIRQLENAIEGISAEPKNGDRIEISDIKAYGLEKADKHVLDAQNLYDSMRNDEGSFWSVVYARYMKRELAKETVKEVMRMGLEETRGNYRALTRLFRMPLDDYKRFLNFARKHDVQLPFRDYR